MYDYLTESELESERECKLIEVECIRLENALDALVMKHKTDVAQIETSAICEGYTEDQLVMEYTQEAEAYMEGVKEWWEKFKEFFRNMVNKLLGRHVEETPAVTQSEKEVEVEDPEVAVSFINKVGNTVKQLVTLKKVDENGEPKYDFGKIATLASIGVATTGAVVTAITGWYKPVVKKIKVSALPALSKKLKDAIKNCQSTIDKLPEPDNEIGKVAVKAGRSALSIAQKVLNKIAAIVDSIANSGNSGDDSNDESKDKGSKKGGWRLGRNNDKKESDPKNSQSEQGSDGNTQTTTNDNKSSDTLYSQDIKGLIKYSVNHNYVGMSAEHADSYKKGEKTSLSADELANIYNAAKKNNDVNSKIIDKWKLKVKNQGPSVKLEFVNGELIVVGDGNDSIYESIGFNDIDRILNSGMEMESMLESADQSAIDDIIDILDSIL